MSNAPVILFVYNRPAHALKTLNALQANRLASATKLYIYADGARENASEKDVKNIAEVRKIIRQQSWCGQVKIIEQSENLGLAKSIISGVSEVISQHKKAIILEDDIMTSPGFLEYMNTALHFYQQEEQVMHISAYLAPIQASLPETFFYNNPTCWGWATWERAWQLFDTDAQKLLDKIEQKGVDYFNINGSYNFLEHLQGNLNGTLNTWAIFWYASVYLQDGLCLHPHRSLVQNIGIDGTGEHCDYNTVYHIPQLAEHIKVEEIPLKISEEGRQAMADFYRRIGNPSFSRRVYRKIQEFIRKAPN